MKDPFRKHLSVVGLVNTIYKAFSKIPDKTSFNRSPSISLTDILMTGIAVFALKCPSLLAFEKQKEETATEKNLKNLYHVKQTPSDTYLRQRLDAIDSNCLRPAFKKIFAAFQRGKGIEKFTFLDGHVLLSGDGTGQFHSNKINCPLCCQKKSRDGTVSYYHQMFGVCMVHPNQRNVIPFCPEPILKRDGTDKNDCERNACKRFLQSFRREHPHLKAIFLADGLSSNAPNIEMLREHKLRFILIAKPGDHRYLFEQVDESDEAVDYDTHTEDGCYHQFRFLNNVSLNKSHKDVKINVLKYCCSNKKGGKMYFSWITDIKLKKSNVLKIAQAGRARWKIENETFNTLKNLGYNFTHNYGHGKQYLSTNFCFLMMLAFAVDQIQEMCCTLFQNCKQRKGTYRGLWETMRSFFQIVLLESWEKFYKLIISKKEWVLDTS